MLPPQVTSPREQHREPGDKGHTRSKGEGGSAPGTTDSAVTLEKGFQITAQIPARVQGAEKGAHSTALEQGVK